MTRTTRVAPTTKTSLVTGTTGTTDTRRDDEQTTGSDTSDTDVRQHTAAQPRPRTETQTAYLPRTALGVIAVNWK
ncbi:MAG TPA: hypothetical protein VGF38_11900 [Ktedonobacterales bacterium]|jgi:hypothetical protein